jgi:hypothetical protein
VDERGKACSMMAEMIKLCKTLNEAFKEGENLGDLDLNGSIVLYQTVGR